MLYGTDVDRERGGTSLEHDSQRNTNFTQNSYPKLWVLANLKEGQIGYAVNLG